MPTRMLFCFWLLGALFLSTLLGATSAHGDPMDDAVLARGMTKESPPTRAAIDYVFGPDFTPYTALTGDVSFSINGGGGNLGDGISATQTIPFPFNFNGTSYTGFRVSSNGWLGFGEPTNTQVYSPLMSEDNVIAFASRNLNSVGAVYSHVTEGTAPNRIHKIQAANFRHIHSQSSTGNVQVWLYEGTNVIEVHYGHFTDNWPAGNAVQSGIRGNGQTDARGLIGTDLAAWSNPALSHAAAVLNLSGEIIPTAGQVFRWTPPAGQPACAQALSPTNNSTNVANKRPLIWRTTVGGLPTSYDVYLGTTNPPPLVATVNTTEYTPDPNLLYGSTYYWRVVPRNSDGTASGCSTWSFTLMPSYSVPHSQNFNGSFPGWRVEDTNSDGTTWFVGNNQNNLYRGSSGAGMYVGTFNPVNDWLFSTPIQMTGGTSYAVRFFYRAGSTNPERLRVTWGEVSHSTSMTQEIADISYSGTAMRPAIAMFTPDEDGTYYVGFHARSPAGGIRIVLDDVTIYDAADDVWNWRGTASSNWYNGSNWRGGIVPGATDTVHVPAGTPHQPVMNGTSADSSVGPVNHLTIAQGAEVFLSNSHSLRVQSSMTNDGVIQQTRNIGAGATVQFARIDSQSGSARYSGVRITNLNGSEDMGSTVVRVAGNQDCANDPASEHVRRCFDIVPASSQPATIRFYYLPSEANGNPENQVSVYRWNGDAWEMEAGAITHSSGGSTRWVQVTGVASGGHFSIQRGPLLSLSPNLIQFGQRPVGSSSADVAVSLGNAGAGTIDVTSLPSPEPPFHLAASTCAPVPFSLAGGQSCLLSYRFTPQVAGVASQDLLIDTNVKGSRTLTLTGVGTQGNLGISPTLLDFGQQGVGTSSAGSTVTLVNTGSATLSVMQLEAPEPPFARNGGSCPPDAPFALAAGNACTLMYVFSPTVTGNVSQTIAISADVPGGGTVQLGGEGVPAQFSLGPNPLQFGEQLVGSISADLDVTLGNQGLGVMQVTELPSPEPPFALTATTCASLPFVLASGESCTLSYRFAPLTVGEASQDLLIDTDVKGSRTLTLTGVGTQGSLGISPTLLDFGQQGVGTSSTGSTVTLANTGNAALSVTQLEAPEPPFARNGGSCPPDAPFALAAGNACTLMYVFSPTVTGNVSQTIAISADVPGGGTVQLDGEGVPAQFSLGPNPLQFGEQPVGSISADLDVTLGNQGLGVMEVTDLPSPEPPFALAATTCASLPFALGSGESCTLSYRFAPLTVGEASQDLLIETDVKGSRTLTLTGVGTQGSLGISPSLLDFGQQAVGTSSASGNVIVANIGTAQLNVTQLELPLLPFARSGGSCPSETPFALDAGEDCTLTYVFNPTQTGSASRTITINADTAGSDVIQLDGVGSSMADLAILKTSDLSLISQGVVGYGLLVSNAGPGRADGAMVVDAFPTGLTNISWTCEANEDAACAAAIGNGDIDETVDLSAGSSVQFTIVANSPLPVPLSLSNSASVMASLGVTDPDLENNVATVDDQIVLFRSDFESTQPSLRLGPTEVGRIETMTVPPGLLRPVAQAMDGHRIAVMLGDSKEAELEVLLREHSLRARLLTLGGAERDGTWLRLRPDLGLLLDWWMTESSLAEPGVNLRLRVPD